MNQLIILFGSNSDAEKNMEEARRILSSAFPEGQRFSENHRSAALVKEGFPAPEGECSTYLNAVCMAKTTKSLDEVQAFLKETEVRMGRLRGEAARGRVSIDLDLVEWNGTVIRPKDAAQRYYKVCLDDLL